MSRPLATGLSAMMSGKAVENEYIRFDTLSALVIDDISAMRHAVRSQLHTLGMNKVSVASSASEALELIKNTAFDLILCDYNLNKSSTGQHFLEYLRAENLLNATSIFVMLTAEAEYSYVANAVEFIPDDYLLKPCSESKLRTRLERLVDRRTYLMPILKQIDAKRYDAALEACNTLLATTQEARRSIDVLRRKAEVELALGRHQAVLETYAQATALRADLPWVMMGQARTHCALENFTLAAEIATGLISKNNRYVSAYELLAGIRLEKEDEEGAFDLLNRASEILPSAKRFRSVSEAAYLLGKLETARKSSEAAIELSSGSLVEKADDYLALAQTQVDIGDHKGAIETLEKNARKHGDVGLFGVSKDAILAQAYFDAGDVEKAKKLIDRSVSLLANRTDSSAMAALGRAALKTGNLVLGLKMLTQSVQVSGQDEKRIARHVKKSMQDTGHHDKVEDVIDGGRKRILMLVDECTRLMRTAHFDEAYRKILEAQEIHAENLEALMAAAQLHLLWIKHHGIDAAIVERARHYLSTLDRLLPNNVKVMNFYRFFNEIMSK